MTDPAILRMERDGYPEPVVVFACDECGEDIYEGDDYYMVADRRYCAECMESFRREARLD